jgi:hypothetical protein
MQARDLFGVAIRVLGILCLYHASYDAVFLVIKLIGIANNSTIPNVEDKIFIAYWLGAAFILLTFADHFVVWLYGPTVRTQETEKNTLSDPN